MRQVWLSVGRSLARLLLLVIAAFVSALAVLGLVIGLISLFGDGANGWSWLAGGLVCAVVVAVLLALAVRVGRFGRHQRTELYPAEDAIGGDARIGAVLGGLFLCLFLGAVGLIWVIGVGIAGGSVDDWTALVGGTLLLVPGLFVMEAGCVVGR